MTEEPEEIMPCPMCGSRRVDYGMYQNHIVCYDCDFAYGMESRAKSVVCWNNLGCRKRIAKLEAKNTELKAKLADSQRMVGYWRQGRLLEKAEAVNIES